MLGRFFAVCGCPAVLLSDNGSQIVGAARDLRQMIQGHDPNLLRDLCAKTQWIFTTPAEPHQNGCAEAVVKSCKRAIKNAIGEQVLSPFELYTCFEFMEIGNLESRRPIGRVPNDPDEGKYLCPNDMLLGRTTSSRCVQR